MAKNSCQPWPLVNINGQEERSKLYQDILKRVGDRPRANWIYASYLASNTADVMDNKGYKRGKQGEHKVTDVLKEIDIKQIDTEIKDLSKKEVQFGFKNANGNRTNFTNAKEALDKADGFNDMHKGLVATVIQHGNVFNVYVSDKTSRTHMYPTEIKERLKIWDVYKQAFNSIGVDIENLSPDIVSTFNANNVNIARDIINLQNTQIDYLHYNGALTLFSLDQNSQPVQRLVSSFGSIENAANAIGEINQGVGNYTVAEKTLLSRAIQHCKNVQGLDLNTLQNQVSQMSQQIRTSSPEASIQSTLHQLKKKYNIEINEIYLRGKEIRTLSEAAATAAVQLQRQIRELENQKGRNAEGKKLERIMNQLLTELGAKKYYSGILYFMSEATLAQKEIDNIYNSIQQTGTEMEKATAQAKVLSRIKRIHDQYLPIISALADETLIIDETINQIDIDNIRKQAKSLEDLFRKKEKLLNEMAENTMQTLLLEIIGDTAPDGQSIINLVKMAQKDSGIFNYLYSVGRSSNPMIAAMGSIIRSAQSERDEKMNDIAKRIRRLENNLQEAGYTSKFMYEDDEHIISDIDWKAYKEARKAYAKSLGGQNLDRWDFRQAMETWEDNNTEDRVVDVKTGRTEKVPNSNYRKPFPTLSQAELDYYNGMMEIKGEIGSYLPAYAQKHYLAPQLRRNMVDALSDAKNAGDVITAFKNKVKNFATIREDDIDFGEKGIINGIEYYETAGNYDNTPLRQIPIFYVNRVESGELLKDFSTGLQHLASTAINYDAMYGIQDTVEFMGDFTKSMVARGPVNRNEIVRNHLFGISSQLKDYGRNNNTINIINGFISQYLYGQKLNTNQPFLKQAKAIMNILGYSSFKALSTNVKGAFSNYLVGEFQMLIEAGAGEFYGFKDFAWAHSKLFGSTGVGGEIMELLTNNMNHKATLFRELFDPINDNFSEKGHQRYYHSMFRQLLSKDCSFIGYASGEFLIHYVNMYSVLHREKVLLNGKPISLYDAFEVSNKQDGNSELTINPGVTDKDGNALTTESEYIQSIRNKIRYVNQSTHGAMNEEDKGVIHQYLWGKAAMQFRQWMIGHYSRRFRKRHFDYTLGTEREGYYTSLGKFLTSEEAADLWKDGKHLNAIGMFMKDLATFALRASVEWNNLDDMQKHNVRRALAEFNMYIMLIGLSFALGEPDEHKGDLWMRWWIYQVKRLILDTEASMPHPNAVGNFVTILNSPFGGLETFQGFTYMFTGLFNGDAFGENNIIKSGPHKGENRYLRNILKYDVPFYKDWEQLQRMDEDEAVFTIFKTKPTLK